MKKIHIPGLSLALIISACNTGRTDEENIQKTLDRQIDSIEQSINFYEAQEDRTDLYLESGIKEIDQRMSSREKRKQQEIKRLDLLRKRARVADKKIEAYHLEKQMYMDQKDALSGARASEEEKEPYLQKIHAMDSAIMAERENKSSIEKEIRQAEAYISETDAMMLDLKAEVKAEYDKNNIIESFIRSEKERLGKELEQIQQSREELLARQSATTENLKKTERQIGQLEKDAELIRNKEMSSILELQAEIEESEADLAREEISLLEEGMALWEDLLPEESELNEFSDTSALGLVQLMVLVQTLDSLDKMFREEQADLARTRQDLARKRVESAEKRADFGRTAGAVAVLLLVAGIALLSLFFYLGKKYRAKKT